MKPETEVFTGKGITSVQPKLRSMKSPRLQLGSQPGEALSPSVTAPRATARVAPMDIQGKRDGATGEKDSQIPVNTGGWVRSKEQKLIV